MVVDDNFTSLIALTDLLKEWRLDVAKARDPAAALDAWCQAATSQEPFTLAIVDSILRSSNGVTLAEQLIANADGVQTPCVLLTSPGHPDSPGRSGTLRAAAYVAKPVKPSDLQRAIGAVLDGTSAVGPASAEPDGESLTLPPLKVLLAEDGLVNQTVARRLLEKQSHSVTVVGDGREAVRALKAADFDVVLMDIQMPELDGLAATAEIRHRERGSGQHVPIIAMTAHAMKGDRERCLAAGMDGYVSKPIRSRELFAEMAEVLSLAGGAGTRSGSNQGNAPSYDKRSHLGRAGERHADAADEDAPANTLTGPVIDWEVALDQAAGDRDLVLEMIDVYFDELPKLMSRIEQAIEANDGPALRRAAHTLKGALHHLVANRAAAAAAELERLGSSALAAEGRFALAALRSELTRLEPELLEFQASPAGDAH